MIAEEYSFDNAYKKSVLQASGYYRDIADNVNLPYNKGLRDRRNLFLKQKQLKTTAGGYFKGEYHGLEREFVARLHHELISTSVRIINLH